MSDPPFRTDQPFRGGILRISMHDRRLEESLFARRCFDATDVEVAAAIVQQGLCPNEPYPVRPISDGNLLSVFVYLNGSGPLARVHVGLVDRTSDAEQETPMEERQRLLCRALQDPEQCARLARGEQP